MAAKHPRLCCAEVGGMGPCAEPVEGAFLCATHWLEWDQRGKRTAGERPAGQAASEAVA